MSRKRQGGQGNVSCCVGKTINILTTMETSTLAFTYFLAEFFLGGKVFPDVIFCKESVTVDLLPFE